MDEPFCFLIVRIANITKNMCGNHIPTDPGIVPLAIAPFTNILAHKYIASTTTAGKSLAYLFCLGLNWHRAIAKSPETITDIVLFNLVNNSAV